MTEFMKPSPETFQFMVRYSDVAKTKIDLQDVAKVMGSKYKAAWDGSNKAKKDLSAAGYVAPDADNSDAVAATPKKSTPKGSKANTPAPGFTPINKKRKADDSNDDNDDDGTKNPTSPTTEKKKRAAPRAKVAKVVKTEESEEALGGSEDHDTVEAPATPNEKKKRAPATPKKASPKKAAVSKAIKKEEESDKEADADAALGDSAVATTEKDIPTPVTEKKKRAPRSPKKPTKKEEVVEAVKGEDVSDKDVDGADAEVEKSRAVVVDAPVGEQMATAEVAAEA